MLDLLAALVTGHAGASLRRFARLAVFAAVALVFAIIALAALSAALFLALDDALGPLRAAFILAGGAAALAFLASIPLWAKRKPPPSTTAATLVELAVAIGLAALSARKPKA